jgi:hypothetical protein
MDQCNTEKLMAGCWRKMGSRVDFRREGAKLVRNMQDVCTKHKETVTEWGRK